MRHLSVQLLALIADGVAERNASHAIKMAARLAHGLSHIPGADLLYPVEINEVFVSLPKVAAERLVTRGYAVQLRNDRNGPHYRFVTAWNSTTAAIDQFVAAAFGNEELVRSK